MKAYNPDYVRHRAIRQQAERWQREGLLNPEQLAAVRQAYPVPFRESNVFSEIGTFIFTGVAVGGAYALLLLLMPGMMDNSISFGAFNALISLGLLALAHSLINRSSFYRNGPDNALVVLGASFLLTALNIVLPGETAFWFRSLLAVPVLLAFVWYYGDIIVTFMALLAFYASLFAGLLEFPWGKSILPFVLMGVSIALYMAVRRGKKQLSSPVYYAEVLSMVEWIALMVLAAAGNYFVVRELNGLLTEVSPGQVRPDEAPQITVAWLFWLLTFLIPGIYLYLGIVRKSRMFIILGALGTAAALSTVRYYYRLLPLSIHLTLTGALLLAGTALLIRYLRQPRFGFTDVPDEESPRQFFLNAELLTVVSTTSANLNRQPDLRYGEGDFGGGGAGKTY